MKILFVTGNKNKFKAAKKVLEPFVELEQVPLDLEEIQGDAKKVALRKARDAYKILKKSLIINDSSLVIEALKGFPGPYSKYVEETLGEEVIKLLEDKENKTAYYLDYLVYIDKYGYEIFESRLKGEIVSKLEEGPYPFDRIFRPHDKTLTGYDNSTYHDFLNFLKKRRVARGITVIGNKVLLLHRNRLEDGKLLDYYAIPGGGLEPEESVEEALVRELKEETSIDVTIKSYLGMEIYETGVCYYFETSYQKGKIELGGEEKENNNPNNHYEIALVDIKDIDKLYLYGQGLAMIKKVLEKYQNK